MNRGKGHLSDHDEDVRATPHVFELIGARAATLPLEIDGSPMLEQIPEQGQTSACVGEALATSIYLRAKEAGHPIERPSAKAIYDLARLEDTPRRPLVDQGSRPTAAIRQATTTGLVATSRWPLTEANVNVLPALDVFEHALDAKLGESYRIPSGKDAPAAIRKAVAQGYYPIYAQPVDQAYENYDGSGIYAGLTGPSLGGHMQCIAGYGVGYILVAGSWGRAFGRRGFALVADAFFASNAVSDILVPTVVPRSVS